MSKNQNISNDGDFTQNQNNAMSDDPADGGRNSFTARPEGKTPVEKAPKQDAQNQATIEEFGREGLGLAAKE
jgi:hypothetical protein